MRHGYVNSSTGEFHSFTSEEAAQLHAVSSGLTRFTIRPVIDHRTSARQASPEPDSMAAFLALGQ